MLLVRRYRVREGQEQKKKGILNERIDDSNYAGEKVSENDQTGHWKMLSHRHSVSDSE